MKLDQIYKSNKIGVRSFNICKDNGLTDMTLILEYFKENHTFKNLKNCGLRSDRELIDLCSKHLAPSSLIQGEEQKQCNLQLSNPKESYIVENDTILSKISNFNRIQREVINSFIEINSNNLTNRSRNAVRTFLKGNLKIRNFNEKIFSNNEFNIQDLKNVGAKSTREINSFIVLIKEFVEIVSKEKNEKELVSMKNKFFIQKNFSISKMPNEILNSLSIFRLVDFLLKRNALLEKAESIIFKKALKVYRNHNTLTLNQIAEELNISNERVRQIRKGVLENLNANLSFISNIEEDFLQKYKIEINQKVIFH